MSATKPKVPSPRRIALRLPRLLGIGLASVVLSVAPAAAGDPADDEFDANAPRPELHVKVATPGVYRRVFGNDSDATAARNRLDVILRQKVNALDLICELTDAQRQKLELAGRGDNQRLLDRVEKIGTQLQRVTDDGDKVRELLAEAELLKRSVETELSNDGSLLSKLMRSILTTEQNARIVTLREIEWLGGNVRTTELQGQNAILHVDLSGVEFADEGLARLAKLPNLHCLDLTSTQVTDAGFVHLARLTRLQSLNLTGIKVTDEGLAHLAGLTQLERLDLFGLPVTAAGLTHLKGLTNLKELNLSDTRLTNPGLAHIKGLKNLQSLNLHWTQVTDVGLVHLRELTSLEWLDLSRTQTTDAGVAHLRELHKLQWVNLSGTQVTDAGLADLKRALPTVSIWKRSAQ